MTALVLLAAAIVAAAFVWGWRDGSLHPSDQEQFDAEFERIVRGLDVVASPNDDE